MLLLYSSSWWQVSCRKNRRACFQWLRIYPQLPNQTQFHPSQTLASYSSQYRTNLYNWTSYFSTLLLLHILTQQEHQFFFFFLQMYTLLLSLSYLLYYWFIFIDRLDERINWNPLCDVLCMNKPPSFFLIWLFNKNIFYLLALLLYFIFTLVYLMFLLSSVTFS